LPPSSVPDLFVLHPDWPPAFLPPEVVDRIRQAPQLYAERPTPLLFFQPDVPWILGERPPRGARGVDFTSRAAWSPPRFPDRPAVALFRAFEDAVRTGVHARLAGLRPVYFPLLRYRFLSPPSDMKARMDRADLWIFTSPRGVEGTYRWLKEAGSPWPSGKEIWAIGPSTARSLQRRGCVRIHLPDTYSAEGLVEALSRQPLAGRRALLFRTGGRDLLPEFLKAQGVQVDTLAPYVTEPFPEDRLRPFLPALCSAAHWAFTSPSTVVHLHTLLRRTGITPPDSVHFWSIGPATSQALRQVGWSARESQVHTPEGLIQTLTLSGQGG